MVPDLFFDLFARRLREKSGVFAPVSADPLAAIIGESMWSAVDKVAPPDVSAVAVDGGVQSAGLSDGRQLVVARAIAISSAGSAPVRDVDLDVAPQGGGVGVSMMTRLEMGVAAKAVREGRVDYALMDGSLYVKIMTLIHSIALDRVAPGPGEVREAVKTLESIKDFLDACRDAGARSLFVSKDSHLKIIKDYLIFTALQRLLAGHVDGEDLELLSRGAQLYSLSWLRSGRQRLAEIAREYEGLNGDSVRLLVEKELDQYLGDSLLLGSMARREGVRRGVSRPMLVGAVDAYLRKAGLDSVDSLGRAMERRAREAGASFDAVTTLSGLPRVLMFHVKAGDQDIPLMVETPLHKWGFLSDELPRKLFYEYDWRMDAQLLMSQYVNPLNYNRLLMLAHHYATFTAAQFQEYLLLAKREVGLGSSRRGMIGFGMLNG